MKIFIEVDIVSVLLGTHNAGELRKKSKFCLFLKFNGFVNGNSFIGKHFIDDWL